jgi:hypothetical protein
MKRQDGRENFITRELPDLYSSLSIITMDKSRKIRWAGHVARMGKRGGRIGCREESQREGGQYEDQDWLDNIRMDLGEVGWSDVGWIGLAQDRDKWRALVNAVMNLRVP